MGGEFYALEFCAKAEKLLNCSSPLFHYTSYSQGIVSGHIMAHCKTFSFSVWVLLSSNFTTVVRTIVVYFAVHERIFAPFTNPAAAANFGSDCIFIFFLSFASTYAHAKRLPADHFDSRLVPQCGCHCAAVWIEENLQASGSSSLRINQAFVSFNYLFLVTNFIPFFPFFYSLLPKREEDVRNINLSTCTQLL